MGVPCPSFRDRIAYRGVMSTRGFRAPSRLLQGLSAVWVFAVIAAGSACASTDDGVQESDDPAGETALTTTTEAPAEPPPTEAPTTSAGPPPSEGTVEIGDTVYEFAVSCEELGAGEVIVVGAGEDPDSGGAVELYVQAFLGDPYIGLRLEDGTLFEPSLLEGSLDLYVQDDVIRASAIRFVKDLDLETGAATEVGFGELEIHCYEYSRETNS